MYKSKKLFCFFVILTLLLGMTDTASLVVNAASNTNPGTAASPDFEITRVFDKNTYTEGESGKITYTVKPTGSIGSDNRNSADIVIVFDVSPSMKGDKLAKATIAAERFLDSLNGTGYKVALVTFGYKTQYQTSLSSTYSTVKNYIKSIQNKDLFEGTNYHDALKTATDILKSGTALNKYVVFLTDGMPNYFTSNEVVRKYENNSYTKIEGGKRYYTNWPKSTPEAYLYAEGTAYEMADSNIKLFAVGVGRRNEVDITYLDKLAKITSGKKFEVVNVGTPTTNKISDIFTIISSDIIKTRISNIVIEDSLPAGITLGNNDGVLLSNDGLSFRINVPDIVFEVNKGTPQPVVMEVNIELENRGTYPFNSGQVNYLDVSGASKIKDISDASIEVIANGNVPSLEIGKTADPISVVEGEPFTLQYQLNPKGVFDPTNASRKPMDIVLVIDRSKSMQDKTSSSNNSNNGNTNGNNGNGNAWGWWKKLLGNIFGDGGGNSSSGNSKLVDAKAAAVSFVDSLKQANKGDNVSVVTFNRYSKIEVGLSNVNQNYSNIVDKINAITNDNGSSFDSGTNYEIGLKTAQKVLNASTNSKYIIFLSDGEPNFYLDDYNNHLDDDYYRYYDPHFWDYLKDTKHGQQYNYQAAYNEFYSDKNLSQLNLENGKYPYYIDYFWYPNDMTAYDHARNAAQDIAASKATLYTIGLGSANQIDMNFMTELAQLGGGKVFTATNSGDLNAMFNSIATDLLQQKISNMKITEKFPEHVKALDVDNTNDDGSITLSITDIVFERDNGTPAQVTYDLRLVIDTPGTYELSPISKVEFKDYKGNAMTLNFPTVTVKVEAATYRVDNLNAEKVLDNSGNLTGIRLSWIDNQPNLIGNVNIEEFVIMRKINDTGAFEVIGTVGNNISEFVDTDIAFKGKYVYRIDTKVKGQSTNVIGAESNPLYIIREDAVSNIGAVAPKAMINGKEITSVIEGYKLLFQIDVQILDAEHGKTSGGIVNPSFEISLNKDKEAAVNYYIKEGSVPVLYGPDGSKIEANLTKSIDTTDAVEPKIVLSYDGILVPGGYKIEFEATPKRTSGVRMPDEGVQIKCYLEVEWKDNGLETLNNKQIEYTLTVKPKPRIY